VANALQHAAEMGIVHRDIKPENILLTRKGEAKVADFGLSRCLTLDQPLDLTRSGTAVGTPMYMSPEQVEGTPVDCRSDLYSFGVTCYQMLAGETPFTGTHAYEIALKHVREEPAPLEMIRPDAPRGLCAVVHKLMAKKPRDRYQSAHDLLKDIGRVRAVVSGTTAFVPAVSVVTEPVTNTDSPAKASSVIPPTQRRRMLMLLGLVGIALLSVGVVTAIMWHRTPDALPVDAPEILSPTPSDSDRHHAEPQDPDRKEAQGNSDTHKGRHDGESSHPPGTHRPGRFPFHRP
jgi:serine/threonine-protein kinase